MNDGLMPGMVLMWWRAEMQEDHHLDIEISTGCKLELTQERSGLVCDVCGHFDGTVGPRPDAFLPENVGDRVAFSASHMCKDAPDYAGGDA